MFYAKPLSQRCILFFSVCVQQVQVMGFFDNRIVQIIIACSIPFFTVGILGYGSQQNMYPWYKHINKPSWSPPDWVFAPVWFCLYLAMGFASFRVWEEGYGLAGASKMPLLFYIIQLLLNATWP